MKYESFYTLTYKCSHSSKCAILLFVSLLIFHVVSTVVLVLYNGRATSCMWHCICVSVCVNKLYFDNIHSMHIFRLQRNKRAENKDLVRSLSIWKYKYPRHKILYVLWCSRASMWWLRKTTHSSSSNKRT